MLYQKTCSAASGKFQSPNQQRQALELIRSLPSISVLLSVFFSLAPIAAAERRRYEMMEEKHEKKKIYHEKQRLQFCLLHSLNNLLQDRDSFTRAELDAIASKLLIIDPNKGSWTPLSVIFKPHHNTLTGNYDVNVLIAALEGKGKRVVWHDRRNAASSIDLSQSEETLMGIVVNVPVRRYAGLWKSRHWVTVRRIEGIWYNLDSDLAAPLPFQHEEEVKDFLDDVISQGGEILIVLHGEQ